VAKRGKKYESARNKIDRTKKYAMADAFKLLDEVAFAKFDESVDVAFNLGVDPKHADQMVRGAITLPHGVGKSVRVIVFAKGEKAKDAEAAGAMLVGAEELVEKINGGWMDFDKVIATPDMMGIVSKVARVLGPRGLMPNPKLGTVTMDVAKAVKEQQQGRVEYRTEKTGIVQVSIGKKSFGPQKLTENFVALYQTILRAKPATSKGTYMKGIALSTTMSPSISVDPSSTGVAV
jgi:large subunit ribosomal protein L1